MNKFAILTSFVFLLAACRQNVQEVPIVYYTSSNPYDIVKVEEPSRDAEIRNIILMIGDGMGMEQVSCAWVVNRGKLNLDNMPVVGLSRTYCTDQLITDSGAGGTALASGFKTAMDHIGVTPDTTDLNSIFVYAKEKGMATGVAVTCHFADATPCDFCCHNEYRYNQEDLIADYLDCGVDYLSGGGTDWFTVKRTDGRNIIEELSTKGYNVALSEDELMKADLPAFGILSPDNLPVAQERGDLFRHSVSRGLDLLSRNENGFVMMIEGSCIDDWLHGNDIGKAVEEILDFDRTLGDVLEWAAKDGHTLVVVTADHATGCLTLRDGSLEEGTIGVSFASESHNGIAVPLYAWGPGSAQFTGIHENAEYGQMLIELIK
ncbi:MAG: alkaline phosphatase [Bacteroidales bacterium]|nr:alkaline phosphatase [Bacteroidales bacterium]